MAYPTVVGVGTVASGTGDVSPGLPSGWAVGDIHVIAVATANEAVTAPSGWNETASSPQGTGTAGATSATRITAFWRRAESGDTAPTITDPGNHCAAVILGLRGCRSTGDPWDASGGRVESSAVTSATYSAVTTTVAECLIVYLSSFDYEVTGTENVSVVNAALSSITDRSVQAYADGNGSSLAVITGQKATAGSIGSGTITWRSGLIPQSGLHGLITLSFPGDTVGGGSASFSFTAAAGGISDRTGSGSASFSFTAAAGGAADAAGSGSASFTFAAEGIPKLEGSGTLAQTLDDLTYTITGTLPIVGELFQTLTDLSTTITADLDKFGSVAKTLEDLTLEGTGYTVTLTGSVTATLEFLETATEGTILGVQGASRAGVFAGTLADVAISSSGEREGVGDVFTTFDELTTQITGLISLTREGAVTATLENVSPEGTGGVGFGAVLVAGLRPGNLQNLEWYITGQTETHGSVTGTLDGITTGITGTGTDAAVFITGTPAGPGVVGNRYDGLIWEAPVSHWQSLCSNTLEPRSGNPIAGCVICVTPIAMP